MCNHRNVTPLAVPVLSISKNRNATATVPRNYLFIYETDKRIFSQSFDRSAFEGLSKPDLYFGANRQIDDDDGDIEL